MTTRLEDIQYLTISELAGLLRTRALSTVEVTRAQPERIDALDDELASFLPSHRRAGAGHGTPAEREIAQGRHRGPLHGVLLAIKDLFWTNDVPTAAVTALQHQTSWHRRHPAC
jgi:amidase